MLDDRKAAILCAVVEEYIRTASPVGSSRAARTPGVDVSPATVRAEMSALEDQEYLYQPHTSAGRVPTPKAYRFFVNMWRGQSPELDTAHRHQLNEFFAVDHGDLESTLADTTKLLSELTDWTAVVVGPESGLATVRSVQLVDLTARMVLVVAVMSNGAVEKRTLDLASDTSPDVVAEASRRLAQRVVGLALTEVEDCEAGDDPLVAAALEALREAEIHCEVYVGGTANLTAAFVGMDQLSEVLELLEQQMVVVTVMRSVLDRGNRVAIGEETGVSSLSECSLVLAPYSVAGVHDGTIGVLGPTRMDYPQALSAVSAVSVRLGAMLREG